MKNRQQLKKLSVISVAVITLGIAGAQLAGAGGPGKDFDRPYYGQGFNDEQQALRSAFLDETVDIRKNMAVKRAEMHALMNSNNPDGQQVSALSADLFDLRETMRKKAAEKGLKGFMGHGGPGMMGHHFGRGPGGPGQGGRM